jgi:tRNA(fMet)-specific endonuclease VapC
MSRRYLLDTNAVSDLLNARRGVDARAAEALRRGADLGTCPPVVGELYHGAEKSASRDRNLRLFRVGLRSLKLWPFDRKAAEEYGRLAAELDRIGRKMQVVDMQLAAVALTLGNCSVVSSDSDLLAVPGLTVENWAA